MKFITSRALVLGIQAVVTAVLAFFVVKIGILPTKYLMAAFAVLVVLWLFMLLLTKPSKHKKTIRPLVGKIVSLVLSIAMVFGTSKIIKGDSFLSSITNVGTETTTYSLVVLKSSGYKNVSSLKGKTIDYYANDKKKAMQVREKLEKQIKFHGNGEEDNAKLVSDLYNGDCDAILLNESYRDMIKETYSNFDSKTKVLWQEKIVEEVENTASDVNVTKKPFVCYISGVDSRGGVNENSRSDVNLLVTVNPNNGQILMTSIPRDYYVKLANCGKEDKLTHSALYGGTENSVKTIENFLDINIDFYARVDFQSVIQLVDTLGGIDIYSDKEFVPYTDHGIKIPKGNVHMDGRMALAFARERYTYQSGDQHRTENQQAVLQAIIKKAVSPKILTNYSEILDSIKDTFTTNMPSSSVRALVNKQLDDNLKWEFQKSFLKGEGVMQTGGYSMPKTKLWYCIPDKDSIELNSKYINAMCDGKKIDTEKKIFDVEKAEKEAKEAEKKTN